VNLLLQKAGTRDAKEKEEAYKHLRYDYRPVQKNGGN
jgi:hypothetical protein